MNKKVLFALWGGLFLLCAALGFFPEPEGWLGAARKLLAVCFFLPGALLLYRARRERDVRTQLLIRNLSGASLGLTLLAIVANFLSLGAGEALGDGLYAVLVILSSPMICGGNWLMSLFLWACLLTASIQILQKR